MLQRLGDFTFDHRIGEPRVPDQNEAGLFALEICYAVIHLYEFYIKQRFKASRIYMVLQ